MGQDVVVMSAQIMIFVGDDAERMCQDLDINMKSVMVNALQEEIHSKAVVRACTRFNDANNSRVF